MGAVSGVLSTERLEDLRALEDPAAPGFLFEVLGAYRETLDVLLVELEAQVGAEKLTEAGKSAHTLKSSSLNIGADLLGQLAAEMETIGRAGSDLAAAKKLLPQILAESKLVLKAIEALPEWRS